MFSMPDVAVILGVALLIFGPSKLPDIGKSLGRGIKDFKKAVEDEPVKEKAAIAEPEQVPAIADQTQSHTEGEITKSAG